jgi:hypothetical protein
MGMRINKSGGNYVPLGINNLFCSFMNFAYSGNFSVSDAYIGTKTRHARTVNNGPIFNEKIVLHETSFVRQDQKNSERQNVSSLSSVLLITTLRRSTSTP